MNGVLEREDVEVINLRLEAGERGTAIARDFCVSQQVISAIKRGQIWGHVTGRERIPRAKRPTYDLTDDLVRQIDEDLVRGDSCREVAQRYGLSYTVVYNIKIGKTWGHITGRQG